MSTVADTRTPAHPPGSPERATSVYRYYDDFGILIYVGITRQGIRRNLQHNRNAEWWPYVIRQEVEHCPDRDAALAREKQLIREFQPPFNKQHNPSYHLVRGAYLAFRAFPRPGRDGQARYVAAAKRLDCVIQETDGRNFILRTTLIDTDLATTVRMHEPRPVYLADVTAGTQHTVGLVDRIETDSPFLYAHCHFTTRKAQTGIERARIHLAWQQVKLPHYPYVRHVKLYLPGEPVES